MHCGRIVVREWRLSHCAVEVLVPVQLHVNKVGGPAGFKHRYPVPAPHQLRPPTSASTTPVNCHCTRLLLHTALLFCSHLFTNARDTPLRAGGGISDTMRFMTEPTPTRAPSPVLIILHRRKGNGLKCLSSRVILSNSARLRNLEWRQARQKNLEEKFHRRALRFSNGQTLHSKDKRHHVECSAPSIPSPRLDDGEAVRIRLPTTTQAPAELEAEQSQGAKVCERHSS